MKGGNEYTRDGRSLDRSEGRGEKESRAPNVTKNLQTDVGDQWLKLTEDESNNKGIDLFTWMSKREKTWNVC